MIWAYVALVLVFVLAIGIIVGTALSRLGAEDGDPYEHHEDEAVDEADDGAATGEDLDRAKSRHPSAHRPALPTRRAVLPASGSGRGQAPHQPLFLPRPRGARER